MMSLQLGYVIDWIHICWDIQSVCGSFWMRVSDTARSIPPGKEFCRASLSFFLVFMLPVCGGQHDEVANFVIRVRAMRRSRVMGLCYFRQ